MKSSENLFFLMILVEIEANLLEKAKFGDDTLSILSGF